MSNNIEFVAKLDDKVSEKSREMFEKMGQGAKKVGKDIKELTEGVGDQFGMMGKRAEAAFNLVSKAGPAGVALVGVASSLGLAAAAWEMFGETAEKQSPVLASNVAIIKDSFEVMKESVAGKLTPIMTKLSEIILHIRSDFNEDLKVSNDLTEKVKATFVTLSVEMIKNDGLRKELKARADGDEVLAAKIRLDTAKRINEATNEEDTKAYSEAIEARVAEFERFNNAVSAISKMGAQGRIEDGYSEAADKEDAMRKEIKFHEYMLKEKDAQLSLAENNMMAKSLKKNSDIVKLEGDKKAAIEEKAKGIFAAQEDSDKKTLALQLKREKFRLDGEAKEKDEFDKHNKEKFDKALAESNKRDAAEIASARKLAEEKKKLRQEEISGVSAIGSVFGSLEALMANHTHKSKELRMALRAMLMMQTVMNTAAGVMNVMAQPGMPFWVTVAEAAAVGAMGAAQLATISQQSMERGGMIRGGRHSQGGVPINAEGGEAVLNRKAVQMLGEDGVNALNNGSGGGSNFHSNITINAAPGTDMDALSRIVRHATQQQLREFSRNQRQVSLRGL